jgi:hypothetical protein
MAGLLVYVSLDHHRAAGGASGTQADRAYAFYPLAKEIRPLFENHFDRWLKKSSLVWPESHKSWAIWRTLVWLSLPSQKNASLTNGLGNQRRGEFAVTEALRQPL